LRKVWSGALSPNLTAVNLVGPGRRRMELIDCGCLDVNLPDREAAITLAPHVSAKMAAYFLVPLVYEGLIQAGHQPVHAASLEVPCGDGLRSVLIVGKSGAGKSTTALALTNVGWKVMGDDFSLLSYSENRLGVWGFPRECHVRPPTLALLPWLNQLPLEPASSMDAFNLPLAALGSRASEFIARPLPPALIIVLDRPNAVAHRCERLDRTTALVSVVEENVQPIEGCRDAHAHAAFSRFAELVRQAPAVRLSAGPRLEELADFLRDQTEVEK
jgi:hypothetical protein